jgi:predicted RNase H-like HicB family nuclease
MSHERHFMIRAEWDPEALVWYVAESDVPGLAAEADTVEELARELQVLVPELLELNAHLLPAPVHGPVPLNLIAHQHMELSAN